MFIYEAAVFSASKTAVFAGFFFLLFFFNAICHKTANFWGKSQTFMSTFEEPLKTVLQPRYITSIKNLADYKLHRCETHHAVPPEEHSAPLAFIPETLERNERQRDVEEAGAGRVCFYCGFGELFGVKICLNGCRGSIYYRQEAKKNWVSPLI